MRTNQPKKTKTSTRRPILMVTGILVIAAITIVICLIIKLATNQETVDNTTPTQTTQSETTKTSPTKTTQTTNETDKTPVQNEPTDADTSILTGYFTSINPIDDTLSIRVLINQQVPSTSICNLEITSASGGIFNYPAPVVNNPSSSSCEGYDLPLSELPVGEPLNFTLTLITDTETYIIAEKEVTL